jgi:hypothetical protein
MCRLLMIAVLGFTLAPLRADDAENRTTTPVADALDWYSLWQTNAAMPSVQTCRGEHRESQYSFRCDPLGVVVSVSVGDTGYCSIAGMRPSFGPSAGLRVLKGPFPTPRFPVSTGVLAEPSGTGTTKPADPRDCGELPLKEGTFEIAVTVRSRQVNKVLSVSARDAALKYFQLADIPPCLLRFPNVKTGDPFFHVYEECQGVLEAVWEFTIEDGQVADFAQWTYTPKRTGLPAGAELRRNRPELWFGVSRPEERAPTATLSRNHVWVVANVVVEIRGQPPNLPTAR